VNVFVSLLHSIEYKLPNMKTNLLLTICFSAMLSYGAYAGETQTLTINGQTVDKLVSQITFNGDNVVFHFADNSTQSADMNTAVLSFSHATDIQTLNLLQFKGVVGDAISLSGIADGSGIAIYDAAGHQQLSMKAQGTSVQIDVAAFQKGLYLLKVDKQVIKFMKR
jgi:hypothetical protein